ncbi:pyridoxal phosphate-dependent aminotransferase [Azohydromonas lata]|uniref:Histidinol-phosphate transaminase n=1 Tax=Azohydromonas lata TaxID=45677 RepID=A0ABU5IJX9_9BURK|nr:histidinol-phosphate transaminase [Azohydromonas lata]MDZ5459212.1 histidinol-phosphate transaminase [Azohydromonas lata]
MSSDAGMAIFDTRFHNPSIFSVRATANARDVLDFCVPANPYFPPPALVDRIQAGLADTLKYYPDYAPVHQENISRLIGLPVENIVVANGVTEIITQLCLAAEAPLLTDVPTFGRWTDLPLQYGMPIHFLERRKENGFRLTVEEIVAKVKSTQARTFILCNPSNPTGACSSEADIARLLDELSHLALVVIDESFIDFAATPSAERLVLRHDNAMVVKSMGKSLGWHGMRLGYGVAHTALAERVRARLPYWNINGLAGQVLRDLQDFHEEYRASFPKVAADRRYMQERLGEISTLVVYPSEANFILVELPAGVSGKALRNDLLQRHAIFVRECSNKVGGSEALLRLVVRKRPDVDRLVAALKDVLATA